MKKLLLICIFWGSCGSSLNGMSAVVSLQELASPASIARQYKDGNITENQIAQLSDAELIQVIRHYYLICKRHIDDSIIDIMLKRQCDFTEITYFERSEFREKIYRFSIQELIDAHLIEEKFDYMERLNLSGCFLGSLNGLQNVPGIEKIKELLLNDNQLTEIPRKAFKECKNLQILSLRDSNITHISSGAFIGLYMLWELDLSGTACTSLPKGVFKGLYGLSRLHLSNNKLVSCNPAIFKHLPRLNKLILTNKDIILPETFKFLGNLYDLSLEGCRLRTLPKNLFTHLKNLRELDLSNNELSDLSSDDFQGLQNLWGLNLSGNQIEKLPSDVFCHLKELMGVNLSQNPLHHIQVDCFRNLKQISTINVSSTNLSEFPSGAFYHSSGDLKSFTIDLQDTQIKRIIPGLFDNREGSVFSITLNIGGNNDLVVDPAAFKGITAKHVTIQSWDYHLTEKQKKMIQAECPTVKFVKIQGIDELLNLWQQNPRQKVLQRVIIWGSVVYVGYKVWKVLQR